MTREDLGARVRRLEQLTRGLAQEAALWRDGNDPLNYRERMAYLAAIQDALAAAETGRVVLARAYGRMDLDAIPRPPCP